jgi:colanic acid biosynthesis glycosyl transferase WcaI
MFDFLSVSASRSESILRSALKAPIKNHPPHDAAIGEDAQSPSECSAPPKEICSSQSAEKRRLIFVNRFFFPDHSATSQILSDLAFYLASMGRDVHVVTSTQVYDAPQASLPREESINDVRIHRVPSTGFGRGALVGRSIDYLSFYRSVRRCLMELTRPHDILIAKTDPPLVSLIAMAVARRKEAGLINWLQDLYPELAIELGVPFLQGPLAAGLIKLRNWSLRRAEANVVVGDLMAQRMKGLGLPAERIRVIPNWCDDFAVQPLGLEENPLRKRWGLDGKFVCGYSGNLGRVHEFDTVLKAAELLRGNPRIIFLMIGGGKRSEELAKAVEERALAQSFRFIPYQERELLAYSLGVPDVHWLSLNPKLEGMIVPSKFYGIAAAGKPIIVIGHKEGELARLVQEHRCGLVFKLGDATGLAAVLLQLEREPSTAMEMGTKARQMLDAHFTRKQAFARWSELLGQLDELPYLATAKQQSFDGLQNQIATHAGH